MKNIYTIVNKPVTKEDINKLIKDLEKVFAKSVERQSGKLSLSESNGKNSQCIHE